MGVTISEKIPEFKHGVCYNHHVETGDVKQWEAHIKEFEVHQVFIKYKNGGWIGGELATSESEKQPKFLRS